MNFGSLFSMVWKSLLTERAKYRKYRILDLKAKDLIFSPYLAIILGLIPGLGRSPGEGNGNSLQHSCLENPMDGGAWWATVQFSRSVVSDSLWSQGLQHARPPCLSPTLGVYSNSCALNWWCHPTISSSVNLFSSCLQSFPASGSFQMSQLFASGSQSIGCFCISPSNEHTGLISFKMDWLDLLAVQGTLKSLLQHHSSKASILWHSAFFIVQLSYP